MSSLENFDLVRRLQETWKISTFLAEHNERQSTFIKALKEVATSDYIDFSLQIYIVLFLINHCAWANISRICINDPTYFYYICGERTLKKERSNFTDPNLKCYRDYFTFPVVHKDKHCAPHFYSALHVWKI